MIRRWLFIGILALSSTGCALTRSLGGAHDKVLEQVGMLESERSGKLRSNAHVIQMALEMYAVDHEGLYPATATLLADLKEDYLNRGHLPESPWGADGEFQANVLDADAIPGWKAAVTKGTVLGPGQVPGGSTFTPTTYGALVYRYDPGRKTYDLYAVGRDGNDAVVTEHLKNY